MGSFWRDGALTASLDIQQPHMLGTQLSFVATASLLSLRKGIWWRVPVRAQMGTLALTSRAFDAFPLLFYPANVIAGPVMLIRVLHGHNCKTFPWLGEVAVSFAAMVLRWSNEIASRAPFLKGGFQGQSVLLGCPPFHCIG